ncbi:MAG TPA: DUF5069 domain-containing protein [Candidatus Baltobacteraceae bacterium]|jgi:hypothetical protein|nr:DUF5069 domain-containing protein [Candidatus Baltobacteraceae bacterium]
MESIDLRGQRPRRARAELDGIVFLPRSIDKIRATLPGGDIHDYTIEGFTAMMLEHFGIALEDFTEAVRSAKSDGDVAAYVRKHAKNGGAQSWNDFVKNREIYKGDRAAAIADYPWLSEHPELKYSIDFLDYREEHNIDDD